MGAHIVYSSYDYKPVKMVPVIASFDSIGHITPLYIRINGNRHKVLSFVRKFNNAHTDVFVCQVADERGDDTYAIPLELTFHHAEGMWSIPK